MGDHSCLKGWHLVGGEVEETELDQLTDNCSFRIPCSRMESRCRLSFKHEWKRCSATTYELMVVGLLDDVAPEKASKIRMKISYLTYELMVVGPLDDIRLQHTSSLQKRTQL
jgi:hypothetical protein